MAGKILVVDDDAANRELLEEFLVAEGLGSRRPELS